MRTTLCLLLSMGIMGCSGQNTKIYAQQEDEISKQAVFSNEMAQVNLTFIKNQYVKMIENVEQEQHVKYAQACRSAAQTICFPRSEEHGEIFLEKPTKWTNGFYPGVLWKLLSERENIDDFSAAEQQLILEKAKYYQDALTPEAKRGSTHDLGFILYDSFGEALHFDDLTPEDRQRYTHILEEGRKTLITRFDQDKGVIKSWDFGPTLPAHYMDNNGIKTQNMALSEPWTFPVIVDNMMNLEYLMSSDNEKYRDIAFSHAEQTYKHHYFYDEKDIKQEFPIAYHLYDYDSMRPGNWQGVGNVSAWARGQGWSLYGYVTVVEALQQTNSQKRLPDFEKHVERLVYSLDNLLKSNVVPDWDFFAASNNAQAIAEDQSSETVRYSRILDLCDFEIPNNILPYKGYRPIKIDKSILSEQTLDALSTMTSAYDEPFIQGDSVLPCGSKAYQRNATHIPKDTSAAALYAAALYRLAQLNISEQLRDKSIVLADKIMAELTNNYMTKHEKGRDFDLGFVLNQATGNLPNASEINTSIVYADFYFLEANIRKLALQDSL